MNRIRSLVNAEVVVTTKDNPTEEKLMQIGAQTWFEATKVVTYKVDDEQLADIYLKNENVIEGIAWGPSYFENHGVPEEKGNDRRTSQPVRSSDTRPVAESRKYDSVFEKKV